MGLGKTVDRDSPLPHARQRSEGNMVSAVGELCVNLIREHKEVFFLHHFRDSLKILPAHDGASGVVRERKDENLRLFRDMFQELFFRQTELIFRLKLNDMGLSAGQNTAGNIGNITGLRDQHLIAGIQHDAHRKVDGLTAAHRNQCLGNRVIIQRKTPFEVFADLLPELL